ncbi:DUF1499 domain-containing protein [Agrobacterium sp. rho-13.3]|uniref:DUF1499 domain-containing protein n=1 Tax=Agrobacterium sp. rho-13.3 TaxID=3072980 RepID=UPI002A12148B|nr:DUF1499 domain-containing protein [Agrobacterium sp. rho-13.3]MDX8308627.1 DUF1499 domain-containing protein [Agrobacterium sp. rho-13.3]
MTVRFVRPVSYAAYLSRYLGLSALVLFLIAAPLHRFGPLTTPDFISLALISAAIAGVAFVLAIIGLQRLWSAGAKGGLWSLYALVLSAVPLGIVGFATFLYWQKPQIYDVSTDVADAPNWLSIPTANQQWLPRPAIISKADRDLQAAAYPTLAGHRYEGAIDRVYTAARKVAKAQRIRIIHTDGLIGSLPDVQPGIPKQDQTEGATDTPVEDLPTNVPVPLARPADAPAPTFFNGSGIVLLQGDVRTLIWGQRFDILIRLREDTETTLVDVRVASRFGPHDLGMGAEIAEAYLDALDAEMQGLNDN